MALFQLLRGMADQASPFTVLPRSFSVVLVINTAFAREVQRARLGARRRGQVGAGYRRGENAR